MLYKLLTGVIPYPGESLAATVYARMHRPPPLPGDGVPTLPKGFDDVIAKALAMEPDDRFQSCRALAVAARAALDTTPGVGVGSAYTSADRLSPDLARLLAPGLASGSSGGRDGAASTLVLRFRTRSRFLLAAGMMFSASSTSTVPCG